MVEMLDYNPADEDDLDNFEVRLEGMGTNYFLPVSVLILCLQN